MDPSAVYEPDLAPAPEIAAPSVPPAQPPPSADIKRHDRRPTVLVPGPHETGDGQVREVGTDVFAREIIAALPPTLLTRRQDAVGVLAGPVGARGFRELSPTEMRLLIDEHVRLEWWGTGGQPGSPGAASCYVACTHDNANLVLAAAATSNLPRVDAVVHYPHYGPGLELAAPGLDPRSCVLYDPPEALGSLEPMSEGGLAKIHALLEDFPFADEAAFENAVGFALTLLLRRAIVGHVPIHLVTAPEPRLGKTTLCEVIYRVVVGSELKWVQLGRNEEERQKQISSALVGESSVLGFDNIAEGAVLDSPCLASFVTSYEWQFRVLGKSQMRTLPNHHVVVGTGNNLEASEELAKRIVQIALQLQTPGPRVFRHADILGYASDARRELLSALVGLVESWKSAGRPRAPHGRRLAGFEEWSDIVGGVLAHAGATSWMSNFEAWLQAATPGAEDAQQLTDAWWQTFGDAPTTATQILPLVRRTGAYPHVLEHREVAGQARSLGRTVLKLLTNRIVNGRRVVRATSGSNARYRLQPVAPLPAAET